VLRTFGVLEALQRTLHGDANIGTSSPNITCFTRRSASKKISLCNLTQSLPKRRREKLHRSLAALAASNLGFERTPESIFLVWSWSRRSSGGTVDPVPCRALTKGIEREREPVFRERKAKVAGQSWHGGRPWDPSRHWHRSVDDEARPRIGEDCRDREFEILERQQGSSWRKASERERKGKPRNLPNGCHNVRRR